MRVVLRIVVVMLACTLAGCATTPPAPVIGLQGTPDAMHRLAAAFGSSGHYTHVLDETSLVLARTRSTETNVVVFLDHDATALQALLTCPWRGQPGDAARVDAWNATHPTAPAFLDDDRRPVMVVDLALPDETTPAVVGAWAAEVLALADAFVVEVWPAR